MADDQTHKGGAPGAEGSAAANESQQSGDSTGTQENQTPKTVSWENHKRALNDLHKFKKELTETVAKLGDLESQNLKDKEDYKALYEKEADKRKAAEEEVKKVKGWAVSTHRFAEVKSEAVKAGLLPSAINDLELIPMEDVDVEVTSTGRFLVNGAKEFIDGVKNDRPHWFQKPGAPNVNGGGGGAPQQEAGELQAIDVVMAERNWKNGKLTRKQYEDVHQKFRTQKAARK